MNLETPEPVTDLTRTNPGTARPEVVGSPFRFCTALTVIPAPAYVDVGGTWQFTAVATYNDGSEEDVTANTVWTGGPGVSVDSSGLATGISSGTDTVVAEFGGKNDWVTVTIDTICSEQVMDIVLVLNRGASMQTPGTVSRMEMVRDAAIKFLDAVAPTENQTGVVTFAGMKLMGGPVLKLAEATLDCPLAGDTSILKAAIESMYSIRGPLYFPDETSGPNTRGERGIGKGLQLAKDELLSCRNNALAGKVVVLFTDGRDTVGSPDPATVATAIKTAGIVLVVVGLQIPSDYQTSLTSMASPGLAYFVDSAEEVANALVRVPNTICYGAYFD